MGSYSEMRLRLKVTWVKYLVHLQWKGDILEVHSYLNVTYKCSCLPR